ncbi:Ubiquitin-conjugating enzyme E2 J1 [Orchesella cincta]|uniref:Ubiquitin-conjugating enzyme E2 J1 n=1 Tax=Orchesella cincta TaxID=48709 RepID=A0A1D2MGY0_ORCCI|nr:Ubiquitin-conjugating enzyme E2 J1 [Orchesella cincta]
MNLRQDESRGESYIKSSGRCRCAAAAESVSKTAATAPVASYNLRCPGVKRLMREAAELATPENEFSAHPTETNLFEWHFTIRGPEGSEFEHGIYHGRIIFPTEYPMKPPSFILLTPNGRFQTEEKICLSISNYHPETWLPSWSIRTALVALRSFMLTPGNEGAIGSINFAPEERKKLAIKSRNWSCHECGPIIKLLPVQKPDNSNSAKEVGNGDATVEGKTSDAAPPTPQATDVVPKRQTSAEVAPTQNGHVKDSNPVTSPSTAAPNADNQDAISARNLETNNFALEQQQQHNEPIKNIIYDLGIGCFVVLILALCFRRLLSIFSQA